MPAGTRFPSFNLIYRRFCSRVLFSKFTSKTNRKMAEVEILQLQADIRTLRERLRMKNEKLNVALRAVMSRPRGTPADWEPSRQLEQHVRTLKMLIISAEEEIKRLRMPALHRAAYYGKVKDVQDILGTGVDAGEPFDTELDEGLLKRRATSPLAIAVHNGHLDVAELLAKRLANTYDSAAAEFAWKIQDPKRIKILVQNGIFQRSEALTCLVESAATYPWKRSDPVLKPEQRLECFEWALKGLASEVNRTATEGAYYGPPITFAFQDLRSPDEIPIRLEIIKLLLTYGADPNILPTLDPHPGLYNQEGNIPILKRVVDWGIKDAVYLLLDAGANPRLDIFNRPQTPIPALPWQAEEAREECLEIVKKAAATPLSLKSMCRNAILRRLHECSGARFAESGYLNGSGVDEIGGISDSEKKFLKFQHWCGLCSKCKSDADSESDPK